jgi:exodeoxyribonuclease V alpha subunit
MMIPCVIDSSAPADGALSQPIAAWLHQALAQGWLRALDVAFAGFLWREQPQAAPELILAAALTSYQLGRGHLCLDLAQLQDAPLITLGWPIVDLPDESDRGLSEDLAETTTEGVRQLEAILRGLELAQWRQMMHNSPLLTDTGSPLVFDGQRLYLRRYWLLEQQLLAFLQQSWTGEGQSIPEPAQLKPYLEQLFPSKPGLSIASQQTDWQKLACALALRNRFSIITGGPGTGKTTTVVKLLALLQALALAEGRPPLRIRLAAPTGKAAARLQESIADKLSQLHLAGLADAEAIRDAIPTQALTLHRLLGSQSHKPGFRHNADNPLWLDVLVIDEASMVDLELLVASLQALPQGARLVLLGDKDQLASVEAGAVLGELCARADAGHYRPEVAQWLSQATGQKIPAELMDAQGQPLDQCITQLRQSHRFAAHSGIARLARAVHGADTGQVKQLLMEATADIQFLQPEDRQDAALASLVLGGGLRTYLSQLHRDQPGPTASDLDYNAWARDLLQGLARFQLLAAVRAGPWGVEGLNAWVEGLLAKAGLIEPKAAWYAGRPVMVTQNNYALGLMNGDIGISLYRHEKGGQRLRVAFPASDGSGAIHWVLPSHLSAVETVYAMTVHKSQGSEFDHAVLILPPSDSPVLNRELLYTAITRARRKLSLVLPAGANSLERALARRVQRASGIAAKLQDNWPEFPGLSPLA